MKPHQYIEPQLIHPCLSPQNEEEAWTLARRKGCYFSPLAFGIKEKEWKEIAQYPPIVDFQEYKHLRTQSLTQLKTLFPLQGSKEDLFFYATRRFLPDQPDLEFRLERIGNYSPRLLVSTLQLLDKLYGPGKKNFLEAPVIYETLEKWIFTYDTFIDDPEALYALLVDMNAELPRGADIFVFVFETLEDKIKQLKNK